MSLVAREEVEAHRSPHRQREGAPAGGVGHALLRAARDDAHRAGPPVFRRRRSRSTRAPRRPRCARPGPAARARRPRRRAPPPGPGRRPATAPPPRPRARPPAPPTTRSAMRRRTEHAPVEQDGVGRRAGGQVPREEGGDVARDGDVALVGQTEGDEGAARALRPRVGAAPAGRKPSSTTRSASSRVSRVVRVPPTSCGPRAGHRDRRIVGRRVAEQRLLRRAARATSCAKRARRARRRHERGSTRCASARSMLSPPSSRCGPTATRSTRSIARHAHQRQVGRAAADVARPAPAPRPPSPRAALRTPRLARARHPVVERGLRLLEELRRRGPPASPPRA